MRRRFLSWLLLGVLAWPLGALAFQVVKANARLDHGQFVIDVLIDYRFSEDALEALANGVPLTTEVHIQVRRVGAWIWEGDVVEFRVRGQIRYLPVSALYQVTDLDTGERRNFVSRAAAIHALGDLQGLPVVREDQLEKGEDYELKIKASLDIEALPLPLRPKAYISSAWNLSTGWTRWRLRH